MGMTYTGSGVDYGAMDPFKRMAQKAGRETARNVKRLGFSEMEWSRGESCYLMVDHNGGRCFAQVHEGLGTKNLIAEAMYETNPYGGYYHLIAQDTVAMGVNDMITLGAAPATITMHLAVGSNEWFSHKERVTDLVEGWRDACHMAHCTWSGGETPTLKGIIALHTMELSCSVFGVADHDDILGPGLIQHGDAIILLPSSGVHANGITLARDIAAKLPTGYWTYLSDNGQCFGNALLTPTTIYVSVMEKLLRTDIDLHYSVNITGHGWRKLMRASDPFAYVIEKIPDPQPVFQFISQMGEVVPKEMYGNFNMGAGFALYVREQHAELTLAVCERHGIRALHAGNIERSGKRTVVIRPLGIEYGDETLAIR
jgi:phosphoribosylformylglycinamidine cyclo-ligase